MRQTRSIVIFLLSVFVPVLSYGQGASTATVTGTVTDPKGLTVPAAKIELVDTTTGVKNTVTTTDDGHYTFPAVPPGTYKIIVTGSRFRQAVVNNIKVDVGKAALVNVALELGQVTETVEVVAGARGR